MRGDFSASDLLARIRPDPPRGGEPGEGRPVSERDMAQMRETGRKLLEACEIAKALHKARCEWTFCSVCDQLGAAVEAGRKAFGGPRE